MLCADAALRGYFGFTPRGAKLLEDYPYGGLAEYLTAAPGHVVKLPQEVTFEQGARFGYLGTSFAALRRGAAGPGSWIAIHGVTGTLGVGAVLLALGMGVSRILGGAAIEKLSPGSGHCSPSGSARWRLATSLSRIGFVIARREWVLTS